MALLALSRVVLLFFPLLLTVGAATSKSSLPAFYRVARPDLLRKCPSPRCGGVFVQKLNGGRKEIYVASVDLTILPKDVIQTIETYIEKFGKDLVLYRGRLVPLIINGKKTGVDKLVASTAYLGLPGLNVTTAVTGLSFYSASGAGASVFVRPLNVASPLIPLNTKLSTLTVQPAGLLDLSWQRHEILRRGALISAPKVPWSTYYKNRTPITFKAREVFIRLPVTIGRCLLNEIFCDPSEGLFKTYTRQPNLCWLPKCKNVTGACTLMQPICDDGYRLACWPAPPFGCGGFACDPEFAPPSSKTC